MAAEDFPHHCRLSSAQQAIIDENAGELTTNGLVQQCRSDARIHAAAQTQDHLLIAKLGADGLHRLVSIVAHRPTLAAAADAVDEAGEDLAPMRRVHHLRVKLQAEHPGGPVLDGCVSGVFSDGDRFEASRQLRQSVPMGIPNLHGFRQAREEGTNTVLYVWRALALL